MVLYNIIRIRVDHGFENNIVINNRKVLYHGIYEIKSNIPTELLIVS